MLPNFSLKFEYLKDMRLVKEIKAYQLRCGVIDVNEEDEEEDEQPMQMMYQIPYLEPLLRAYDEREKQLTDTVQSYIKKFIEIEKASDIILKENVYLRDQLAKKAQ